MATINLPSQFSDNFGNPIDGIFKLLSNISAVPAGEEVVLNYRRAKFTHPFYTLAIPLIIRQLALRGREVKLQSDFVHPYTSDYMGYIKFPEGWDPLLAANGDFAEQLERYRYKTYIPIINFPVGDSDGITEIRDQFLSAINRLLVSICGFSGSMRTALMYLIDEAVNNVLHHSADDRGYLLAQYFKSKGYIDLVIADIGRTLLESYKNSEKYKTTIVGHRDAMEAALAGHSTKSGNVDRGFGISTSKEMLTTGLNGKYFLWSGNVFNIHTSEINNVVTLPETITWQGAYLALRIPLVAQEGFNPSDFYG